jgi:hypothetical protein
VGYLILLFLRTSATGATTFLFGGVYALVIMRAVSLVFFVTSCGDRNLGCNAIDPKFRRENILKFVLSTFSRDFLQAVQ